MNSLKELIADLEDVLDKIPNYQTSIEVTNLIIRTNQALTALKMFQEMMELNVPVTCGKKPC